MPDPQPSQPRRPTLVQTKIDVISPYHGWKLYFPDEGKNLLIYCKINESRPVITSLYNKLKPIIPILLYKNLSFFK